MHKKTIRLFISTLLLSLTVLVGGCENVDVSNYSDYSDNNEPSSNFNTENSNTEESRFSFEELNISGDAIYHFDVVYIITDTKTGKQYLYTYHSGGYAGGATMVELSSISVSEDSNNID